MLTEKNTTIKDQESISNFKRAIRIGSLLGVFSQVMLNKRMEREFKEKE